LTNWASPSPRPNSTALLRPLVVKGKSRRAEEYHRSIGPGRRERQIVEREKEEKHADDGQQQQQQQQQQQEEHDQQHYRHHQHHRHQHQHQQEEPDQHQKQYPSDREPYYHTPDVGASGSGWRRGGFSDRPQGPSSHGDYGYHRPQGPSGYHRRSGSPESRGSSKRPLDDYPQWPNAGGEDGYRGKRLRASESSPYSGRGTGMSQDPPQGSASWDEPRHRPSRADTSTQRNSRWDDQQSSTPASDNRHDPGSHAPRGSRSSRTRWDETPGRSPARVVPLQHPSPAASSPKPASTPKLASTPKPQLAGTPQQKSHTPQASVHKDPARPSSPPPLGALARLRWALREQCFASNMVASSDRMVMVELSVLQGRINELLNSAGVR